MAGLRESGESCKEEKGCEQSEKNKRDKEEKLRKKER